MGPAVSSLPPSKERGEHGGGDARRDERAGHAPRRRGARRRVPPDGLELPQRPPRHTTGDPRGASTGRSASSATAPTPRRAPSARSGPGPSRSCSMTRTTWACTTRCTWSSCTASPRRRTSLDYHLTISRTAPGETVPAGVAAGARGPRGRPRPQPRRSGRRTATRSAPLMDERVPVVLLQQWVNVRGVFTVSAQEEDRRRAGRGAPRRSSATGDLAWVCGKPLWPGPGHRRDGFVRAAKAKGARAARVDVRGVHGGERRASSWLQELATDDRPTGRAGGERPDRPRRDRAGARDGPAPSPRTSRSSATTTSTSRAGSARRSRLSASRAVAWARARWSCWWRRSRTAAAPESVAFQAELDIHRATTGPAPRG